MYIPESFWDPLADPLNFAYNKIIDSKSGSTRVEYARVKSYNVVTHMADVQLLNQGLGGATLPVRVSTHFQGDQPGTGEAHALYPGQLVQVAFMGGSATGMYNQGTVVGTVYTHKDSYAPAYAPWQQSGTGSVVVHPTADGKWGNAMHTDDQSNVSMTRVARVNKEDWGNEHHVVNGPNITRSEELTRRSSTGLLAAANQLEG